MIESLSVVAAPDGTAAGALERVRHLGPPGTFWGQSEHFPGFNAEEAKNLMALFADPIERASEGIIVGGSRYVFLNGGDQAGRSREARLHARNRGEEDEDGVGDRYSRGIISRRDR